MFRIINKTFILCLSLLVITSHVHADTLKFRKPSPLLSKGDVYVRTATADVALNVGANGTVLSADSSTATGLKWVTPPGASALSSPLTTKGDIWVWTSTNARLPIGTDGQILSADSSQTTGLKWVAAPTGGAGTPGGSNTQLQFNNSSAFGGATLLTWDSTNSRLLLGPGISAVSTGISFDVAGSSRNVPVQLADGSSIAIDASRSNFFWVQLTGQPRTLANPTNGAFGQKIIVMVSQDSTGSRKMGFGTNYAFGSDVPSYDATTTAGMFDFIGMIRSVNSWDVVSVSKGYR